MSSQNTAHVGHDRPQGLSRRLSTRDLITVGVFTAIYFVMVFASGMLGMINPLMSAVGFLIAILINGTVVMTYMVKVQSFGAMSILGTLVGIMMVVTGHFWGTVVLTTVLGVVADLIVKSGNYRSRTRNIFAYGVFQLWLIGPMIPMFYDTAGYRDYVATSMGAEYADAWMNLFTPTNLLILELLCFVTALIGAWFGSRLLERNLSRAGIL